MFRLHRIFYNPNSLKGKILDIIYDMKKEFKRYYKDRFWIDWYGAYDIDPKYLVIWICVKTDATKSKLESDTALSNDLRATLKKHRYPEQAIPLVHIGFESQENVDRESNGDWNLHFK
jgi:hypothetical protein